MLQHPAITLAVGGAGSISPRSELRISYTADVVGLRSRLLDDVHRKVPP